MTASSPLASAFGAEIPAAPKRKLFRNGWEIAAMVAGFVVFWPLGLAALAYYRWRPDLSRMTRGAERAARRLRRVRDAEPTGNLAFEEHRAETLARLEAERRRLEEEERAFAGFLEDLRRQKDREAFDRFMASRRAGPDPAAA